MESTESIGILLPEHKTFMELVYDTDTDLILRKIEDVKQINGVKLIFHMVEEGECVCYYDDDTKFCFTYEWNKCRDDFTEFLNVRTRYVMNNNKPFLKKNICDIF